MAALGGYTTSTNKHQTRQTLSTKAHWDAIFHLRTHHAPLKTSLHYINKNAPQSVSKALLTISNCIGQCTTASETDSTNNTCMTCYMNPLHSSHGQHTIYQAWQDCPKSGEQREVKSKNKGKQPWSANTANGHGMHTYCADLHFAVTCSRTKGVNK